MALKITTTKPLPGPVIVTLEPPKIAQTTPPTIAAIIPEIGGAPDAKANPKPRGKATKDTTNPEKIFLGISLMNNFLELFLLITLQLKHLLEVLREYTQYHVEKFYLRF